MNFCKMCGTSLSAAAAVRPAGQGRVVCGQCGKGTPSGFAFCQHCGHRIQPEGAAAAPAISPTVPAARNGALSPIQPIGPSPTPPAGVRAGGLPVQGGAAGPFGQFGGQIGGGQHGVSGQIGGQHGEAPAHAASGMVGGGGGFVAPQATGAAVGARGGQALLGRLIAVRRDGSDGDIVPLTGESFDIGRTEGSLCFAEDPFLAPRHARLVSYGGVVRIRPLDMVNGVFVRLRDPHELQPGDIFYIGKELVRFESLSPEERDPPSLVEHGVRLFGSAPRESWGRLRQLSGSGVTRDMWYLSRPEVVLGREEGDIIFPDDEFMSRRHAQISRAGGRPRLLDQNSSNGTYLRLRGDRELRPSDVLRMGDQLLRFEP